MKERRGPVSRSVHPDMLLSLLQNPKQRGSRLLSTTFEIPPISHVFAALLFFNKHSQDPASDQNEDRSSPTLLPAKLPSALSEAGGKPGHQSLVHEEFHSSQVVTFGSHCNLVLDTTKAVKII